jgi:hypothetical protein
MYRFGIEFFERGGNSEIGGGSFRAVNPLERGTEFIP